MRYQIILSVFLIVLCAASVVFAQNNSPILKDNTSGGTEETYKIGEVRGNIKRKAVNLPKPIYPREALEAGADGIVKVEVVIDSEGKIVSAKAIEGHPLLIGISEETARKTKFRSLDPAVPDARETGVIIYNFALEKTSWMRIGYELAVLQKAPSMRPFNVPRIAKTFESDWTGELEILKRLAEMRRAEIESPNVEPNNTKPIFKTVPPGTVTGRVSGMSTMERQIIIPNPPTPERIALSQNLIAALQSRLASNESNLWKFNAGVNFIKAFELYRNPNERRNAAQVIRESVESAPPEIPAETLGAMRRLIEIFESGDRRIETANEISQAMSTIFKTK